MLFVVREYDEDPSNNNATTSSSNNNSGGGVVHREYKISIDNKVVVSNITTTSTNNDWNGSNLNSTSNNNNNNRNKIKYWYNYCIYSVRKVIIDLFLPIGYPSTVAASYLEYQLYDSVQGLCSYLRGVLCSAAVLEAAGVGDADATALSAALTWATKDGMAMVGGLLYSYYASPKFDCHVKEFRLFADIINDVGLTLDMMAPYFAKHTNQLLLVGSCAVLCKTICGISAGATKSSITQHFAINGNMADLNAKESTQETLMSLIGMILGIWFAKTLHRYYGGGVDVDGNNKNVYNNNNIEEAQQSTTTTTITMATVSWTIFIILTVLHVWANYRGVDLLRMRTINRARADIIFDQYLKTNKIPSTDKVHESLIRSSLLILFSYRIHFNTSLPNIINLIQHEQSILNNVVSDKNNNQKFVYCIKNGHAYICLLTGATIHDELIAFLTVKQALLMENNNNNNVKTLNYDVDEILKQLHQNGWETERLYLGFTRKRWQIIHSTSDHGKKDE